MNILKRLKYQVIISIVVISMIVTTQVVRPRANPIDISDPAIDFTDILFIKRERLPGAENLGNHMCDQYFGFHQIRHSDNGLYILENAFSENPTLRNVLENSYVENGRYEGQKLDNGAFLSPDLSYCGTKIVFAYTDASPQRYTWNVDTTFHIFKVNIDGTGLTQLTDGPWNDFDPVWLPDEDIVFISERRGGYGRCHGRAVPTYTLHRMKSDGSDIRIISYHETNEWNPSVDNNGMIIYTRWDYVDRGATHMHSAWITSPDGNDARAVTLNYPIPSSNYRNSHGAAGVPLMQMSLRAVPNSNKYIGTASAHHGQNYGSLIMIDPDVEDDDRNATITNLTSRLNGGYPESSGGGTRFATPYPLSEDLYMCVYSEDQGATKYGIYLLDSSQNLRLVYRDPNISALSPIPVKPREKPNAITPSTMPQPEESNPEGRVMVANVYDTLLPLPEGTKITHLRIWQVYPKTTPNDGTPRVSYEQISAAGAGRNTRGLLGTVPVEEDGSAYFYMPSGKAVFFQAIEECGTAVQTMRSAAYIVPGQTFLSCQGCHEPRHRVPENADTVMPLAMRREPSVIEPDSTPGARPVSFPRLIQPVLDRKCISCHDGVVQIPDLRGTPAIHGWSTSYVNLMPHVFLYNVYYGGSNQDRTYPRTEPGIFGARASSLYTRLKTGHGNLTADELHRFAIWLDSGIAPFYGAYHNIDAQRAGEQVEPLYD